MNISLWDIMSRIYSGKAITESDFDTKVLVPAINMAVQKYDINYTPQVIVPYDDDLADRVFAAALEFFLEVGVYCKDTSRIITFSKEEVEEALQHMPKSVTFGEGSDRREMPARIPEDSRLPFLWLTALSLPVTEELFYPIVESYCAEPTTQMISCPSLRKIRGVELGIGNPQEYFGATRMAAMLNDARTLAGRPGIPVGNAIPAAISAAGILAATIPRFGLRPSDGYMTPVISEFKIDCDRLLRNVYMLDWGANNMMLVSPIMGGMCGGPAQIAVATTAYFLMGATLLQAKAYMPYPIHYLYSNSTHKPTMWATNLAFQAITRNANPVIASPLFTRNGAGTQAIIYESAAWALGIVTSGSNVCAQGFAGGGKVNLVNPLDVRITGEVAKSAAGMSRKEANELSVKLYERYAETLNNPEPGETFPNLYDVERRKPLETTYARYLSRINELKHLGILD